MHLTCSLMTASSSLSMKNELKRLRSSLSAEKNCCSSGDSFWSPPLPPLLPAAAEELGAAAAAAASTWPEGAAADASGGSSSPAASTAPYGQQITVISRDWEATQNPVQGALARHCMHGSVVLHGVRLTFRLAVGQLGDALKLLLELLVSKEHIIQPRHVLGLALKHLEEGGSSQCGISQWSFFLSMHLHARPRPNSPTLQNFIAKSMKLALLQTLMICRGYFSSSSGGLSQ